MRADTNHMNVGVRTIGDLRHRAILLLAAVVAVLALVAIVRAGSGDSSRASAEGVASLFGLGRSTVSVTPRVEVSGAMQLPEGYAEQDVRYTIQGGSGADNVNVVGDGVEFSFTAPAEGQVTLKATATLRGEAITATTRFVVGDPGSFAGTELAYRGRVLIEGGRAVTGEAVRSGARIDASKGEVSFLARVASDGSDTGRLEYSGTEFQVDYEDKAGGRRLNQVVVARETGKVNKLHVEAEPKPYARYAEVSTPDAVAMVKGTGFDVVVSPDASKVEVDHGVVRTWDRFRYYIKARDLVADESMRVDALDLVIAAELASKAMQMGGSMMESAGSTGMATRPHQAMHLDENDQIVDRLVEEAMELMPPLGGGGGDGSGTGGDDGVADMGTGATGDGTSGGDATGGGSGAGSGDGTTTTTSGGGTTGGTDSGTNPPPPPPPPPATNPAPPNDRSYELETFTRYGYEKCLATHLLWNGEYADAGGRHLCLLRGRLDDFVHEKMGYKPLLIFEHNFGCLRVHGIWRHNAGSIAFCFPLPQGEIDGLGTYERPQLWAGGQVAANPLPCSDGHTLVDGLCRRIA